MNPTVKNLTEAAFVADELRLYLDTHPCEQRALADYSNAVQAVQRAKDALPYGISALDAGKCGEWDWVQIPFPWEMEE